MPWSVQYDGLTGLEGGLAIFESLRYGQRKKCLLVCVSYFMCSLSVSGVLRQRVLKTTLARYHKGPTKHSLLLHMEWGWYVYHFPIIHES